MIIPSITQEGWKDESIHSKNWFPLYCTPNFWRKLMCFCRVDTIFSSCWFSFTIMAKISNPQKMTKSRKKTSQPVKNIAHGFNRGKKNIPNIDNRFNGLPTRPIEKKALCHMQRVWLNLDNNFHNCVTPPGLGIHIDATFYNYFTPRG